MHKTIELDANGHKLRNPDGSLRMVYVLTPEDHAAGLALYFTGPIDGLIALPTGTEYDVTDHAIAVKRDHVQALHAAIHAEHHERGNFLDVPLPS